MGSIPTFGIAPLSETALSTARGGLEEQRLQVVDDGIGLVPGHDSTGFGLTSMRERVAASGGTFRLASTPGHGTTVEASWAAVPGKGSARPRRDVDLLSRAW